MPQIPAKQSRPGAGGPWAVKNAWKTALASCREADAQTYVSNLSLEAPPIPYPRALWGLEGGVAQGKEGECACALGAQSCSQLSISRVLIVGGVGSRPECWRDRWYLPEEEEEAAKPVPSLCPSFAFLSFSLNPPPSCESASLPWPQWPEWPRPLSSTWFPPWGKAPVEPGAPRKRRATRGGGCWAWFGLVAEPRRRGLSGSPLASPSARCDAATQA